MPEVDYCVVGAGFAGLTAALRLKQAGHSVALLEARDRVGGRTFTETRAGASAGQSAANPATVNATSDALAAAATGTIVSAAATAPQSQLTGLEALAVSAAAQTAAVQQTSPTTAHDPAAHVPEGEST